MGNINKERILNNFGIKSLQLIKSSSETNTFLGGLPETLNSIDWPINNNLPLCFVGQIDLSEHNFENIYSWLPKQGRLLFFYDVEEWPWGFDPKDSGGWKVILDQGEGVIQKLSPPDNMPEDHVIPERKFLKSQDAVSIPSLERFSYESLGITEDDEEDYDEWREEHFVEAAHHQVGGYPDPVQGDEMEEQCLLVSNGIYCGDASGYNSQKAEELKKENNDWKLLFQIDSDDDLELMWGDCGMLYFWIKESDAKALNFDNVWVVLQCH